MDLKVIAIIPARGGSKGVVKKNIRIVGGFPLIYHTINCARNSNCFHKIYTTTDDDKIAEIAESYHSEIIRRPKELAEDNTPMYPVIKNAIEFAQWKDNVVYDIGVVLQPTAPLRIPEDIRSSLEMLKTSEVDSVVSVNRVFDHHPMRMYRMSENRLIPFVEGEPTNMLRQNLPPVYHRNGAIYAFKTKSAFLHNNLFGKCTFAHIMPLERSVNIDEEIDLLLADLILSKGRG